VRDGERNVNSVISIKRTTLFVDELSVVIFRTISSFPRLQISTVAVMTSFQAHTFVQTCRAVLLRSVQSFVGGVECGVKANFWNH
jgi:hypothetical protein